MRVLVACEFSGIVRDAFGRRRYVRAIYCQARRQGAITTKGTCAIFLGFGWDLMIAHPPCTYLAVSDARWFKDGLKEQADALRFVRDLMAAPIERICIENPISVISSYIRKPDQIIQPWMFGHGETKATCLWLKNLPKLVPTKIVEGREARVHKASPGPDRWKERSRTLIGVANAMADQWGKDATPGEKG